MANSKYEYVKAFERCQPDILLPNTWIVIRLDGRGFHKLTAKYEFDKPNDRRALDLMNAAAVGVMTELPDLVLAYGISDEYSFVFHKDCMLFERRAAKLITTIATTFTSYYIHLWGQYFAGTALTPPMPSFDGRAVMYPSVQNLRDYMSWRQVDCHINNLYNTTFWALIQQGGMDGTAAEKRLMGSVAADKHEILFKEFSINYNNEPEMFKKGTVLFRDYELEDPAAKPAADPELDASSQTQLPARGTPAPKGSGTLDALSGTNAPLSKTQAEKERKKRQKAKVAVEHVDVIRDEFWERRPWILSGRTGRLKQETKDGAEKAQAA
ncbi:uncharacterized protein K452DRAFT_274677 [Aplosporella prunicola CBS 121167]|uniref:tRNA(His) guanylyltransferase n=1 Tax=Aplosporella prunicola CBS 121167 TaxID=1176127 RepID=A0A6A6B9H8_9PEZI|nr:uncharacterized protein K452DRAFT_274677 [Aplosporella prunicola CBS 121167]KAF2140023.1 hypothetical protein K452DRAFT_274677 [Aplosporella prunicola CBS 121167]